MKKSSNYVLLMTMLLVCTANAQQSDPITAFFQWLVGSQQSPIEQAPKHTLSHEDYLQQLRHDLKGLPPVDINEIVSITRKKLRNQNPSNDYAINKLLREGVVDRVRTIARSEAGTLTQDRRVIDISVHSIVGSVKARLNRGDNLNDLALQQFFDRNELRHMINQNISSHAQQNNYTPPVYRPSAPPASQVFDTVVDEECAVCMSSATEKVLVQIPCKNGFKHSAKMCKECLSLLHECPIMPRTTILKVLSKNLSQTKFGIDS